jgi:hypothetical protein
MWTYDQLSELQSDINDLAGDYPFLASAAAELSQLVGDAMVDASPGSETDDDGTATEPPAGNLTWTTSGSADAENHDQETDLDSIGSPGGASWASVAPDSLPQYGPWHWVIYDRWIDVDDEPDPTLAEGQADTEDEAKAAVTIWVRLEVLRAALRTQDISFGELQELQNLAPYIESGDTELLEAAGVPEYPETGDSPS